VAAPLTRRAAGRAVAAGIAGAALGACAAIGRQTAATPTGTYRELLDRWTRSDHAYHELETRLRVSATYRSWPFRQAYVAEYSRIYLLPPQEQEALLARETASLEQFHEFLLSAYTQSRQTGDFLSRTGIWRLYLEGPDRTRVPTNRVDRPGEPPAVLATFYPYIDRWSRVYVVRFPRRTPEGREVLPRPETDTFRLILASTAAQSELVWGG
jgi:hypothetical protein